VPLPWLVTTFTTRTVPPMAMARPMTMAMINRSTVLLPPAGFYGMVNVTSAAGPVRLLKLTGTTLAR